MMKKEFGKWFLDLAKYILTAVFLTTYLTGLEEKTLVWFSAIAFVSTLLAGYFLLRSADEENTASTSVASGISSKIKEKNRNQYKKNKK